MIEKVEDARYGRGAPLFSEDPYLRSSTPHPKTDLGEKWKCNPMNNPMALSMQRQILQHKIEDSDDLGSKEPRHSEHVSAKSATSIVERVSWCFFSCGTAGCVREM